MASSRRQFPEPIFVCGVGRSGTHVMGRLIAADPRYHWIRTEVRFHASPGGLPDLCAGRVSMDEFMRMMRGHWWKRGHRQLQGLQRIIDRDAYEAALEEFQTTFERDRLAASRRLVRTILDPAAERAGKPAWVEVTGHAVEQAPFLLSLFPHARFINMIRDGRAVVAATLKKSDLTDEPKRALKRWELMVRAADRSMREIPQGTMLTVFLDDLTAHDRERTFARVVEFLEIDDETPMREYFEAEVSEERAHVGQWRERMAPADARMIDRRYRRLVRRMRRAGISWVPEPG
jgi:Sulfotransferase family